MKSDGASGYGTALKGAVKNLSGLIIPAAAIFLFYGILGLFGITCPIRFLTGISCPGCGMTRAWIHFASGDVMQAFRYHPLFPLPAVVLGLYAFKEKIPKKAVKVLTAAVIAAFLAVYVFRMNDPAQDIVVFCPENGLLCRIIKMFIG